MSSTRAEDLVLEFSHVLTTGAQPLRALQFMQGARCVIGRGADCDVVIKSTSMSRQHAAIRLSGGVFFIEDLGSSGGTWAVARRQRLQKREPLSSGDSFMLGAEEVRITFIPRAEYQGEEVVRLSAPVVHIMVDKNGPPTRG